MGTLKELNCKSCNNQWIVFDGVGMRATHLFCNQCGNGRALDYPVFEQIHIPDLDCTCGGKFVFEPKSFVCPACKSNEVISKEVGLWD